MKTFLIDSGHGGRILDANGKWIYTTAPSKMFIHQVGNSQVPFYEGVYNRSVKDFLIEMLQNDGLQYVDVSASNLDLPLDLRVKYINSLHDHYKNCVLISIHGNAGKGTGIEVWTSPGQTISDTYATIAAECLKTEFPGMKFRADITDGDPDKEEKFTVLVKTKCPAFLTENGFYDNWNDARLMLGCKFQYKVAKAHFDAIKQINAL